jgi:hypothetical protein
MGQYVMISIMRSASLSPGESTTLNRLPGVLVAVVGLLLAGCSEELGPEAMPTARVEGVVRVAGEPVRAGWVEFPPVEGTVGNLRSARIGPEGRFAVDGVAVGEVAVGFVNLTTPPIRSASGPVNLSMFNGGQSPIRRRIRAGTNNLVLDLAEEANGYAKRMQDARQFAERNGIGR